MEWFTSDTHFFHEKALMWRTEFSTIDHMTEIFVQNWNRVVSAKDKVRHCGDFAFKTRERKKDFEELLWALNGTITLNNGNHDDVGRLWETGRFKRIELWTVFEKHNFFTSHIPLPLHEFRKTQYQVHGHVHLNDVAFDAKNRYLNVCMERTIGYRPVSLEEVLEEIVTRETSYDD